MNTVRSAVLPLSSFGTQLNSIHLNSCHNKLTLFNLTVDILAEVTVAESPVQSATIKTLELSIKEGEELFSIKDESLIRTHCIS